MSNKKDAVYIESEFGLGHIACVVLAQGEKYTTLRTANGSLITILNELILK